MPRRKRLPGPQPGDRETILFKRADARQSILDFEAADVKEMGFYPRAFCQIGFPMYAPTVLNEYNRDSGPHHLSIMAPSKIGIPWGIYPRGIMAWIVTYVKKRYEEEGESSRTVNLGDDLLDFMQKVTGTKTYSGGATGNIRPFKRQLASLLASRIYYWYGNELAPEAAMKWKSMEITSEGSLLWSPRMLNSPGLFQSTVLLGEAFWLDIIKNAVPIDSRALKALWPSCLSVDIYVWLTYKANTMLKRGQTFTHISWTSLQQQFGPNSTELRSFKQNFHLNLKKVKQVYPSIEFEEREGSVGEGPREKGLTFRVKRPSILSAVPALPPGQLATDGRKIVSEITIKRRGK
jgi:hypothetical protein